MKSAAVKRSIIIGGHKTSVSLEVGFWNALKEIARERAMTISEAVAMIDTAREHGNLSCAIRLFVLDQYQKRTDIHRNGTSAAISQGYSQEGEREGTRRD
jgi:predicted DNA-binding ribbon-helix-helix protein